MEDILESEIERIEVTGFLRKGEDNVFMVNVVYSNDWEVEVSRRYSDFVALQRALMKFCHDTTHLLPLPAFTELFENVFSDEEGSYCQPSLELLDSYCSSLCDIDSQLVCQFFDSDDYDMKLNRKNLRNKMDCDDIMQASLPQSLVLMDFNSNQGSFVAKAGDTVTRIGIDRQDFALVGLKSGGKMKFGWIPSVYLLEIEGKEDPLIKDLMAYFNDVQGNVNEGSFSRPSSVASHTSIYSTSSSGRESADGTKSGRGVGYYQYCLMEDCYLSCSFGDDVLVNVGDKVVVIDKDTDGWWYVTTPNSVEGWLPSTILEPRRASLRKGNKDIDKPFKPSDLFMEHLPCYVSKTYKAKHKDELSVKAGELVHLLYESPSGWWTVRHHRKVGLVPGLFITKQTSRKMSQPLRKAFSIGFNCSFLTEPPPRREAFSRCSSPMSPPPIMDYDEAMFREDTEKYSSKMKQDGAWTPSFNELLSTSESGSELSSPQPRDTEGVFNTDESHQLYYQRQSLPETFNGGRYASARSYSSPFSSLNVVSRSSLSPPPQRSPIPERFLDGTHPHLAATGRGGHNMLSRRSISPMPERSTRSPIPDRFIKTRRSLTPDLDRSPLPDSIRSRCISPLVMPDDRNSPSGPMTNRRRLVRIAPVKHGSLTDDDITDDIMDDVIDREVEQLVKENTRRYLVRSPHVLPSTEVDLDLTPKVGLRVPVYYDISDDELFTEDDDVIRCHNDVTSDDVIDNDHTYSLSKAQSQYVINGSYKQSLITSSLPSLLKPQPSRAASAPPTIGYKKEKKKVDLRKGFNSKHGLFIPQMETGL